MQEDFVRELRPPPDYTNDDEYPWQQYVKQHSKDSMDANTELFRRHFKTDRKLETATSKLFQESFMAGLQDNHELIGYALHGMQPQRYKDTAQDLKIVIGDIEVDHADWAKSKLLTWSAGGSW